MEHGKRMTMLIECPKCKVEVAPIIMQFLKGTDQVKPAVPNRYVARCPRPECKQIFYINADTGERTDGQAVLKKMNRADSN